jgi:hypothetical protein
VASGIGFTFATGAAMSIVAAYSAVPIVLWVMNRLGVLNARARLGDDVLAGCLAAGAGLLNSLAPFLLCFGACYYAGRSELRRFLLWAVLVLAVGQAWGLWLGWAGRPMDEQRTLGGLAQALLVVGVVGGLLGLARLPRRWGEGIIAGGALAVLGLAAALALAAPDGIRGGATMIVAGLHLPEYIVARVIPQSLGNLAGDWVEVLDGLRRGAIDLNLAAAFPGPVLWLAVAGLPRLPQRWRDWSLAIIVSAALTTFAMDTLTASPHPRLMYLAYPGVYLLAAHGMANLYRVFAGAGARWTWLPPATARGVAVAVVVACALASTLPGQASLWGDWSYDMLFHFRDMG